MSEHDCIFCEIIAGKEPAQMVLEADDFVAFRDLYPQAPTHILIVPRRHIPTMNDLGEEDAELFGRMALAAQRLAHEEGIAEFGYRLACNCNKGGGQIVYHLHLHLVGGRQLRSAVTTK